MHFTVQNDNPDSRFTIEALPAGEGTELYRLNLDFDTAARPAAITLSWHEPMTGQYSLWHPLAGQNRRMPQWYAPAVSAACFCKGAPVLALVDAEGRSKLTAALADGVHSSELRFAVNDFAEQNEQLLSLTLFTAPAAPLSHYETLLRLDRRGLSLSESLRHTAQWWHSLRAEGASFPEPQETESLRSALPYFPLYSTWYSFHQHPEQNALLDELKLAAAMGIQLCILDDGWQFEGDGTGDYCSAGDWQPAPGKFPDFPGFVREVHALGIRLMLWFSVPFAGYCTEAYRRFRDKLLCAHDEANQAGILDPRYPEVRAFICGTILDFARRCDLDGLKLDFIDSFRLYPDSPESAPGMDTPSVDEGVMRLLAALREGARAIKEDFLFEFRQHYVGPEILRYTDMIRVIDCPYDTLTNRIGVCDLRQFTLGKAVHSDMLLFAPEEAPEACARQLLDVLFGVPQLSVRLARCPQWQRELLASHLRYRESRNELLTRGRFGALHPEAGYSRAWAEDEHTRITVLYTDETHTFTHAHEELWNAGSARRVLVENPEGRPVSYRQYDLYGELRAEKTDAARVLAFDLAPGERLEAGLTASAGPAKQSDAAVDRNLLIETAFPEAAEAVFHDVRRAPFELYNFCSPESEPLFRRLPADIAATGRSPKLPRLARESAGGRVRFTTDSDYILLHAEMPLIGRSSHYSHLAAAGFDLYEDSDEGSRFVKPFLPPLDAEGGYEQIIRLPSRKLRAFTLHFPIHSTVSELRLGLRPDAVLGPGRPYEGEHPIVIYGSSIVHGTAASRPGNCYPNMLCRRLNRNIVNLGFSGGCRAEESVMRYLAGLDMDLFVYDYDHNAPDADYLAATHKAGYDIIRAAKPELPIILISRPDVDADPAEAEKRRTIIEATYRAALAAGDRRVSFIDGGSFFSGKTRHDCTADGIHPNDLGFSLIAERLEEEIRKMLP